VRFPCATHLVVLCRTKDEAERVLHYLQEWTSAAGLTLHPTKTRIVDAGSEGVDFLGWHFRGGKKWPRKKSLQKLREKLRPLTRRTNGRSLSEIVARVNPILRGWYGYFRESPPRDLSGPDGWVRRRLRSIQRCRWKRKGLSRGRENTEMTNQWFAERGLFSMALACAPKLQSHS